jgi:Reverse transcriptase (RNA-dependent DNA polymerase)/Zinc knuckle
MSSGEKKAGDAGGGDPSPKKDGGGGKKPFMRHNYQKNFAPRQPKFEGLCDELRGHIYDCSDAQSHQTDQFIKTTRMISLYVGRTMKYGGDVKVAVENIKMPAIEMPADPAANASKGAVRLWEKELDEYAKRMSYLRENLKSVYAIVYGQCTDIVRQKIEALAEFENKAMACDGLWLLQAIKSITYNFESLKSPFQSLHESQRRLMNCTQGKHVTTQMYLEQFKNIVDVLTSPGGEIGLSKLARKAVADEYDYDINNMSGVEKAIVEKETLERYLAMSFILGADKLRYGRLIENLENDYLQGTDKFPETVTDAYNLLTNWKQDPRNMMRNIGTMNDGVSFANVDTNDEGGVALANAGGKRRNGPPDVANITCFNCGKKGHYSSNCPDGNEKDKDHQEGATMLMAAIESGEFDKDVEHFQFHQHDFALQLDTAAHVPKTWILLDNQSTVDVFHNPALLRNIRQSDTYMDIHCNAGVTSTNLIGDLPGYGTVWYHPQGIANILSLARVKEHGNQVTYDSNNGNEFIVYKPDGTARVFKESARGLYYMDASSNSGGVALVNTVAENRLNYTNRDYSRAVLARNIQKIIGRPSTRAFLKIIEKNLLPNCPITQKDIIAAEKIFGPDVGSLKGKTVRRAAERVEGLTVDIPASLVSRYVDVTVGVDIMFVNKIPFLVSISRHIKFCTAELLQNQQSKTLLTAIKHIKSVYSKRGFNITVMLMDGQFDSLRGDLAELNITLNIVSNDEHVPEIERHIRTLKERMRCVYNTLPFKRMPARMVAEMVYYGTFWLNSFPPNDGISDTYSPRAIIIGTHLNYEKHCKLEFGTYVQAHEEHDNSMATRTTGAIALRPTGNEQGGYYFFSLTTGRILNRNRWTALPMPADVIDRVHALARRNGVVGVNGLEFTDRDGNLLVDLDEDDSDDGSYHPDSDEEDYDTEADPADDDDEEDDHPNDDHADLASIDGNGHLPPAAHFVPIAGVYEPPNENENNENENYDVNENENLDVNEQNNEEVNEEAVADVNPPNEEAVADVNLQNEEAIAHAPNIENEMNVNEEAIAHAPNIENEMNEKYGVRLSEHDLRPRRPRDYSHLHATLENIVMTQHSMKKGIKIFGNAGVDAVLKELQQLHDRKVLEPKDAMTMSREEKKASLEYLMFLKKKRNGTIKGRGCADGRKQRAYTAKEDASSPTVAIESLLLSCVIDAMEHRDVATVDIPGAFMQADMDEVVHMRLEGKMAELLVKINPKIYRKYVQNINGKPVLYVELKKALYGTLKAALLFWKRLTAELKSIGFKENPYDWCVMNKMIDGKQCTVVWHVDDLKISHHGTDVVTSVIEQLEAKFGTPEAPLTVTRGKVHDYLGMTIDFSTPSKVKFTMVDYIKNMLDELPNDMDGEMATPAAAHLFEVNPNSSEMLLDATTADMFHHNVAKLLFLCKRARPDIQTSVAFLCTRVKAPDSDDYKKLARVMRYLRGTIDMPLTLEANDIQVVKWWIDAAFAVHADMKSHTGGVMTLGKGTIYATSTRQKLNTKSSTEAELVGVNDVMPQVLWTRYFLEAQGYGVKDSVVYQDNQSAILLEKNGRASSSKRTRHINIRYFFVTDRVASKEVSVQYCPTGDMVADFFTKPLQGSLFKKFRDQIMNVDPTANSMQDHRSVLRNPDENKRHENDEWTVVHKRKKGKATSPRVTFNI